MEAIVDYSALDRLGDEIAELAAHLDAATARLLELIREFDARGGWGNGFSSCAAWLSWRAGLAPGAAREHVRVARALGELPRLARAFARGELSYSKVRALTRIATPDTEERLLAFGCAGTAVHIERLVRGWRQVDRQREAAETGQRHAGRALHVYQDDDGMVVIRGRLAPEVGALVMKALGVAREALYPKGAKNVPAGTSAAVQDEPTLAQQQADALALVAETVLRTGVEGPPDERYQVVVHVDAPALADPAAPGESALDDGTHVSAEMARRLACDATRVVMRHNPDGTVTEIGTRTRTIPPALRRVLEHRDRGCRFPGCSVRAAQGHHIKHWANGGPTTLSNLASLCRRHHRAVHEDGFTVDRTPDGALHFVDPRGRLLPALPRPAPVAADPAHEVRERNEANGLKLHPRTSMPGWLGEPLDVGWAIDVLRPGN